MSLFLSLYPYVPLYDYDGFQMLYADTFTTREEFRAMFDHTLYDKVRDSLPYCKEAFPEIYGKVNRKVRK